MAKVLLTEIQRKRELVQRRMDKFDSICCEYLRANKYTTEDLAYELGIDTSTLWRYRHRVESFSSAPFLIITNVLQLAKCSTETVRYICGM